GPRPHSGKRVMPHLFESADPRGGNRALTVDGPGGRPPARPPLLLFEQVSKWYGPVIGLNQVTLELRGGITGLVGPNGSGKSTLLKLATGQIKPSLGRVTVRGRDAWDWRAKALVGYCPDNGALYH